MEFVMQMERTMRYICVPLWSVNKYIFDVCELYFGATKYIEYFCCVCSSVKNLASIVAEITDDIAIVDCENW